MPREATPGIDEIMGIAPRHVLPYPVSQQSSQSELLEMLNLEDPAACIRFFSETLNYSISPDPEFSNRSPQTPRKEGSIAPGDASGPREFGRPGMG